MPVEIIKERYNAPVNTVEIGRPGAKQVKIGGQTGFPFLFDEGKMPNPPVIAYEVPDCTPDDWPEGLLEPYHDCVKDPVKWAKKCADEFGAEILCVKAQSMHQDYGSRPVDEAVRIVREIADAVKLPLIVVGCGDDERDNEFMPKLSQALKGENCLLGLATQANYKTLAATCLVDGHFIIADSPIDVNIAKQVNILIGDMGFDTNKIVMHPTTTSLGYGMEYVYSIMERSRLAAFMGDKMLAMPFIVFVGQETWKVKEAKDFGVVQGINWEITTSVAMLQAGADLIVMRHPDAAGSVKRYIAALTGGVR
ncbi:MAG: acetyl-CoA decarbonylase/synthase complex subunit delta [Candidatus Omnitrophica bacterium]|nr:acetyl-CoA decarbonylase/synthase complex subunit delta [Candidatus Omnitrophota bacterium]